MAVTGAHAQSPMGWIEVKPAQGRNIVQIVGHVSALKAVNGADFTFAIQRRNGGNSSNSRQSGRFDLAAGETRTLATTAINVEAGDELRVELTIRPKDGAPFQATLSTLAAGAGQDRRSL